VLNAEARVVAGTQEFDRGLGQILHDQLHWLDVPDRVLFKLAVTVHQCRVSGLTDVGHSQLLAGWLGTLSRFIRNPTSSTDCFRQLLKTSSRNTSAPSVLAVLYDNALYKSAHSVSEKPSQQ